jgi:hypothetical protein
MVDMIRIGIRHRDNTPPQISIRTSPPRLRTAAHVEAVLVGRPRNAMRLRIPGRERVGGGDEYPAADTDEVTTAAMRLRPGAWRQISAADPTGHHRYAGEQRLRMW